MKESNWIKAYIVDVLPGMGIIMYVLAIWYNIAYYTVFGIDPMSYMSLTRMLLSIVRPLVILGIGVFFLFGCLKLINFYFSNLVKTRTKANNEPSDSKKDDEGINKNVKLVLITVLLLTVSYYIFDFFITHKEYSWTYHQFLTPDVGMMIPVGLIYFWIGFRYKKYKKFIEAPLNYINLKTSSVVLGMYFIYALIIFGQCGKTNAIHVKENNPVVFEILASDGEKFTNDKYVLVDILENEILLLEKESEYAIALTKENLLYIKTASTEQK